MTEPQHATPDVDAPTDISVDPDDIPADGGEGSATSTATAFDEGDTDGGTGGLDAGGAG